MAATLTPDSALIKNAEYSYTTNQLTLELFDGRRYRAYNVPSTKWRAMRASNSVGRYFNNVIKPSFKVRKLQPAKG